MVSDMARRDQPSASVAGIGEARTVDCSRVMNCLTSAGSAVIVSLARRRSRTNIQRIVFSLVLVSYLAWPLVRPPVTTMSSRASASTALKRLMTEVQPPSPRAVPQIACSRALDSTVQAAYSRRK